MKTNILTITAISASIILASCSGGGEKMDVSIAASSNTSNTEATDASNWVVDTENSTVRWEGGTAGAQVYSHYGTIDIKDGKLMSQGDALTGGSFVVDMTTINPTDENYSEEHPPADLVGHLTTGDFFAIDQFPTASFEITSFDAASNVINGKLTVRGKTHDETIEVSFMEMMDDGSMKAEGKLVFDRQKYDVAWKHYLKDVVLSDDITLDITLAAKKA